jgi:hypothetical protein
MKITSLVIALVVIGLVAAVVLNVRSGPMTLRLEGEKLAASALRSAAETAVRIPTPKAWNVACFIPQKVLDEAVMKFTGTTLDIPIERVPDLRLTVQVVTVKGDYGAAPVELTVEAATTGGTAIAELSLNGRCLFLGLKPSEKSADKKTLGVGIALEKMTVKNQLGGWSLMPAKWLVELAANEALRHFEDHLKYEWEVPAEFAKQVDYGKVHRVETDDHKGWINVKVEAPGDKLSARLESAAVIFVPKGIWVGLSIEPALAPATPSLAKRPLPDLLAAYESGAPSATAAWINGEFLASTINKLGALDEAKRSAHARVQAHEGALLSKNWRDEVLGNGGLEIYLHNNDGKAVVTATPSAKWTDEGLRVEVDLKGSGNVDLHVHLDPVVTGGVGTSVGVKGEVSGKTAAVMKIERLTAGAAEEMKGTFLSPQVVPESVTGFKSGVGFLLKSDGILNFNFLGKTVKVEVPGLGVSGSVALPADVIPSLPLFTNAPIALKVPPLQAKPGEAVVRLPAAVENQHVVVDASGVSTAEGGYEVQAITRLDTLTPEVAEQRRKMVEAAFPTPPVGEVKPGRIEVLVGDLRFGENNDIVKAIRIVAKAVKDTIDTLNKAGKDVEREVRKFGQSTFYVIDKAGEGVKKEMKDLPHDVIRELNNGADWVKKEVNDLPGDFKREVFKPLGGAAGSAGNTLQDAGGKVIEGVKGLFK